MKIILSFLLLASTALSLSACSNTFEGFGRDMERAGQTIQKKAD